MEIVLLERVEKLGKIGDVVKVKPGYARNFLLPRGKALRANKQNLAKFEAERSAIEARNADAKKSAELLSESIGDLNVDIVRAASEMGQLYGSVTSRDISEAISKAGYEVEKRLVVMDAAIKTLGLFTIKLALHPEVSKNVVVNVARSLEEAKMQLDSGKAVITNLNEESQEETSQLTAKIEVENNNDELQGDKDDTENVQ
ncbi:MAG: 50S ribosomal protein L9 [Alphaproteobacteria bacterium]|nr:MAG: 50S ribosomal protein L9 [Alphaproteobacteria bacterium]